MQNVGSALKQELKGRGLVLKYVAEKTGIPYETLKQYLGDKRPIPEAKVRCIILTFSLDPKKFGLDGADKCQKPA